MAGNGGRRRGAETPLETAARLRAKFGIVLTEQMRKPLPKSVFDEMSGDIVDSDHPLNPEP